MSKVTADAFFSAWCIATEESLASLLEAWPNNTLFTKRVLYDDRSVIKRVAELLELRCYREYYSLDAVLFLQSDRVPHAPDWETWLRRVRVAFEHENDSRSGLYKEIAHLLITDCDHRVLVTYTANQAELRSELQNLHAVVVESDRSAPLAKSGSLQIIVGSKAAGPSSVLWQSFVFCADGWREARVETLVQGGPTT